VPILTSSRLPPTPPQAERDFIDDQKIWMGWLKGLGFTKELSSLTDALSSFDRTAPLFHIANSRNICGAPYSQYPMAALWNATDSLQELNFPTTMTSPPIVTA